MLKSSGSNPLPSISKYIITRNCEAIKHHPNLYTKVTALITTLTPAMQGGPAGSVLQTSLWGRGEGMLQLGGVGASVAGSSPWENRALCVHL